jgi:hypothetical protein
MATISGGFSMRLPPLPHHLPFLATASAFLAIMGVPSAEAAVAHVNLVSELAISSQTAKVGDPVRVVAKVTDASNARARSVAFNLIFPASLKYRVIEMPPVGECSVDRVSAFVTFLCLTALRPEEAATLVVEVSAQDSGSFRFFTNADPANTLPETDETDNSVTTVFLAL